MNLPEGSLTVLLHGAPIGKLEQRGEGSSFTLDESYIELPARPVLGQTFEDAPDREHHVRQGIPRWFANLLPEGPLRRHVAERAGVHESRSLHLLAVLGADLSGAVVIEREDELAEVTPAREARELSVGEELKFSLAGMQLKFSVVRDERGLTVPAHGVGGFWIAKLPDQRFQGVPAAEFTMLRWADAADIAVPEAQLVEVSKIAGLPQELARTDELALIVKRFDRGEDGTRIHVEDFAQVLNLWPWEKYERANYETIARILQNVGTEEDVDELVKRLVFIAAIGDGDSHTKNWSLIYTDQRSASLAPAYDLVPTAHYIPGDKLGLRLAGANAFDDITLDRFARFAERAELDVVRTIEVAKAQIARTAASWEEIREDAQVAQELRDFIDERSQSLPLFADSRL